jgi:anthranilate phosphoribosyltransferase
VGSAALRVADALACLIAGRDLTRSATRRLFGELMEGRIDNSSIAGLLVALAAKGESAGEIAGAASAMRQRLVPIPTRRMRIVDTCGTGGDGKGTFNISTAAAIVAAASGVPIAKHGNRSVSSRSGSADVLEALGVMIEVDPLRAGQALDRLGIAFLFAPRLHPAMRQVMPVRQALGIRTIFNILGPLTNPAGARRQVLGVYEDRLVPLVGEVLRQLGCDHALVVRGADGLDELTTTTTSLVVEVRGESIEQYRVHPADLGLALASPDDLVGGDPELNARLFLEVLAGTAGPLLDITVLNAGAAIYVGGRCTTLAEGLEVARQTVMSGAARRKLDDLRQFDAAEIDG